MKSKWGLPCETIVHCIVFNLLQVGLFCCRLIFKILHKNNNLWLFAICVKQPFRWRERKENRSVLHWSGCLYSFSLLTLTQQIWAVLYKARAGSAASLISLWPHHAPWLAKVCAYMYASRVWVESVSLWNDSDYKLKNVWLSFFSFPHFLRGSFIICCTSEKERRCIRWAFEGIQHAHTHIG